MQSRRHPQIPPIPKPVVQKLCAKFAAFTPRHRSVYVAEHRVTASAIRIVTPGWRYAIYKAPDGWAVIPENTSDQYLSIVEMLVEALVELSQEAA